MATRRKQDDRNLEVLRELIAAGANRYCFDCGTRGPTYVNTTIGSFVCSKCSGMLRGLTPPHRVKSISMATFTNEEMDLIRARGNEYCRQIWLSLYEGEKTHPKDEQSIHDFMVDKYEKKRYYLNPESVATLRSLQDVQSKPNSAVSLISISPQAPKSAAPVERRPPINGQLPPINSTNFVPRPTNNFVQPTANSVSAQPQIPEFAVDFSTANIYNSSEHNNNNNNKNNTTPHTNNNFTFSAFNSPPPPSNDRYAALADLDIELRQQKCLNTISQENGNVNGSNRNPFESTSSDLFGSKNPFSNGLAWGSEPAPLPFNPFAPSTTMNGFSNSKNPFL